MWRARRLVQSVLNKSETEDSDGENNDPNLSNQGRRPFSPIQLNEILSYEELGSSLLQPQSLVPCINLIDQANTYVIEPSNEEIVIETSLLNKKCYTDLHNVPLCNPVKKDESQQCVDFSSGSGDINIRQYATSDTNFDSNIRDENREIPVCNVLVTSQENQQSIENSVAESTNYETNLGSQDSSRKRKQFPPKDNKSKKRLRNEQEWKKKAAALARERGKEYLSYKNIVVPQKKIQEGVLCHYKCRLDCSSKFDRDVRASILKDFYSLDVNSKNALLFNSIISKPVARKRNNAIKHKSATYKYFIKYEGVTKEVCKLGLCGLYQISRKKVDIIINQIKSGVSAPHPDRRGKHYKRPHKIDEEVINRIKLHISSFPAEQSHYSRNKNMYKLYLSPLLNVTKMYELYLTMCEEEQLPEKYKIKKCTYNKVFVSEFNLSFGYPKSDTCATCDAGESNEEHTSNYHAAVKAMANDRKKPEEDCGLVYLTVDLQQTMPLPKISTSKAFYLRQIWFYNLGIHVVDGCKEKAVCCTWTEDVADRGSCEVASALLRFVEVDHSCRNKDHLLIWSDSCAGQNKNFNMIVLYQYMIMKGYFKIIDHKFPEVGHSYLDSDRDFGRIEKVLRKHDAIYAPDQYREIICKASRNNVVIDMTDHFRKISELPNQLNLINRKKDVNKQKVCFRDGIRWIRVEEFGSYLYKESYDEMMPFKKVDILKKRGQVGDIEIERVGRKYGTITEEKKANIRELIKFVKPEYRYYYQTIVGQD